MVGNIRIFLIEANVAIVVALHRGRCGQTMRRMCFTGSRDSCDLLIRRGFAETYGRARDASGRLKAEAEVCRCVHYTFEVWMCESWTPHTADAHLRGSGRRGVQGSFGLHVWTEKDRRWSVSVCSFDSSPRTIMNSFLSRGSSVYESCVFCILRRGCADLIELRGRSSVWPSLPDALAASLSHGLRAETRRRQGRAFRRASA